MRSYAAGLDVGGTTVKLGLFKTDGTLLERWEIPTRTEERGRNILPDAAASLTSRLAAREIALDELEGAGLGVPGPVDEAGVVHQCVNLGWGEVRAAEELAALLPGLRRVRAGNDCSVAALGELWRGAGRGRRSAVVVPIGTGVGGGIAINGRIVAGAHGAGGELGHICVEPGETRQCTCGGFGCVEQYASANGVARVARELLAASDQPSALRGAESLTSKTVFDAARAGDALALAAVHQAAEKLGRMLSFVACVVDPEVFILGGGMSRAGAVLLDAVRAEYRKYALYACRETPVILAELGNDAGIYGCAKLAMDPA